MKKIHGLESTHHMPQDTHEMTTLNVPIEGMVMIFGVLCTLMGANCGENCCIPRRKEVPS